LRIDTAPDSVQALQQLSQRRYDLVFLDLELGAESEMDGLALCHHIKREGLAPDASVVMVSAHHSEIDRARGALAGCDGYLAKPLKGGELAALLRRHRLSLSAGGSAEPADLAR
jgi:DNA-binding response OmpR family regulator